VTSKASSSNGEVTQRNSIDAALAALRALYGHERAAEEALAVVHEDPPDDPALAGWEPPTRGAA
jgi:hypothetical protein